MAEARLKPSKMAIKGAEELTGFRYKPRSFGAPPGWAMSVEEVARELDRIMIVPRPLGIVRTRRRASGVRR